MKAKKGASYPIYLFWEKKSETKSTAPSQHSPVNVGT
jgi:hypothetical protein